MLKKHWIRLLELPVSTDPSLSPGPDPEYQRSSPGRALGLDLGERRIGVAICDSARTVATPLTVVKRVGDRVIEHREIGDLAREHDVTTIVVGLPLSLDGSSGPAVRKVRSELKGLRKRLGLEIFTHDERLSTVTAAGSLRDSGVGNRRSRQVVDQVAAAVILQAWIDSGLPPIHPSDE